MIDSVNNTWGKRKSANEVLKDETSNGRPTDITDSENKAAQKCVHNVPVEQDEQIPKEVQTRDTQTDPKTQDPLRNTWKPVDLSNRRKVSEERRSSIPCLSIPGNKQWKNIKHHQSAPILSQLNKLGEPKLGDPLYKSVRNNLALLEGLARFLDKEHHHGRLKCWKHLAEQFGVEESTYKTFTCCPENSPTDNLLYFLKTRRSPEEFTIEKLKEGLNSIDRNDVIKEVLMKHKDLDSKLTDKTTVGSLFDSHPLIIGEIAVLLDVNEPGKKNWRHLADWFGVPKSESQNFAESIKDNPTEQLLEYIKSLNPEMTVRYLQGVLEDLQMQEASDVLKNSKKVTENTLLKDLWDKDYEAVDKLCNHLNQRYNSRIRGWRHLGYRLEIKKEVLDTFSPNEDEVISPTEALFNHLGGTQVCLTMENLIWALDSIDRKDALSVVKDYFPEGVVDRFLEQRRSSPQETAV